MKYRIDGYTSWFVVEAPDARRAHKEGVKEFGRGGVFYVRKASDEDIEYIRSVKGDDAMKSSVN